MVNENWKISQNYNDTCIELLSENLASFRAKAGITQAELANLIGISDKLTMPLKADSELCLGIHIYPYFYFLILIMQLEVCCAA